MYVVNATGAATGPAYCLHCWEVDHRRRSLVGVANNGYATMCPACKNQYQASQTGGFR
jgi:hypothetical protein